MADALLSPAVGGALWAASSGASVSGIVGGLITLALVFLAGFLITRRSQAA